MSIGFDFDGIFINFPPFIPISVMELLYKGKFITKSKGINRTSRLHYRYPRNFEQKIRILSHFPLFRQPIRENIEALKKISSDKNNKTYLVSSRFGFLRKRTDTLLDRYNLRKYFDGIYFNFENQQPHLFKEQTIRTLKIDTYIDDDLDLSLYLSKKLTNLRIFWICNGQSFNAELPKNIIAINDLKEVKKYLKNDE